ncbi:glycoside hydrolase [Halobacillus andaensis]|uniref:Glycoside hydrolase n=1 Tax=Halobacillus andaensis TaxID=1176239 RepID=A0A917B8E2_HALAA|nr:beta-galactosidase [Halobacillus andaensis]MBP2006424.1 beta-galactosidase [Halobacillus andaensis]GGF27291.1 glycoside hydrolase [Halobacillus andaensis]
MNLFHVNQARGNEKIQVKDEKVIINGKETVLFGAELHYFRIPRDDWRARIRQVKDAGINMISTYVPWMFHEYEEGSIDLTGETRGERDFQGFLQLVAEEDMYCLVRPGPYVMAEIVDHGVPPWLIDDYPEVLALTEKGQSHPTRVVSYMHPTFLEKVESWYHSVCAVIEPFQIAHGGPVIMFQLDNEVGMFHWVTNEGDYNNVTKQQFEQYLEEKEVGIEDPIRYMKEHAGEPPAEELKHEYYLFMRKHYRFYLEHLKELAQRKGISVPFIINIHGFHTIDFLKRGTRYPIGIAQLMEAAKMDDTLVAGDYYIGNIEFDNYVDIVLANSFTKAIQSPDHPLFSAEFQGGSASDKPRLQPSTFDLTTRLCFANGMNAVNYYMFVGGENYENIGLNGRRHEWQAPLTASGEKKPHFDVIQHLGQMYRTFEEPLMNAKQTTQTCVAFYPDYYTTEYSNLFSSPLIETFQFERDLNIYNGVAKGLRVNRIVYDSLNIQDHNRINVEEVPTLWMFSMKWMDRHVQQKLVDYLEDGGQLVLFPSIPTKDLNDNECTLLKDYIGVGLNGRKQGFVTVGDIDSVQTKYMETFDVKDGAFAWSEDERKDVAAFEKRLGQGKLIVFGVGLELDFNYKYEVIRHLAEKAGVYSEFTLQQELDVSVRAVNENSYFLFLHNFDEYEKVTPVARDKQLLFDGTSITVPGKSGLMLPVNIPIADGVMISYATAEIYGLEESADSLSMTVKLKQAKDVLVIETFKWKPVESPGVKVERVSDERYKVDLLRSLENEITIDFVKCN